MVNVCLWYILLLSSSCKNRKMSMTITKSEIQLNEGKN